MSSRIEVFLRRRFLDFRNGHSIYLVFIMTFANFITIQYALLIDRVPALSQIFSNPWLFAVVFVALYIPLAVIIGRWHRKNQLKVDQDTLFHENVIGAKMWLFLLDILENKATEEQRAEMRVRLEKIAKK